jgi:hypothetical protein
MEATAAMKKAKEKKPKPVSPAVAGPYLHNLASLFVALQIQRLHQVDKSKMVARPEPPVIPSLIPFMGEGRDEGAGKVMGVQTVDAGTNAGTFSLALPHVKQWGRG